VYRRRLIEDQSRSLPAVAELLGFSAQSALARWFRERFGCAKTKAFERFSAGHVRHFTLLSRMAWQHSGIVLAF
jgi:AraC-like DNA-binding protein